MPEITDEQIKKWRERWQNFPFLNEKIIEILQAGGPAGDMHEAASRMWRVNEQLQKW